MVNYPGTTSNVIGMRKVGGLAVPAEHGLTSMRARWPVSEFDEDDKTGVPGWPDSTQKTESVVKMPRDLLDDESSRECWSTQSTPAIRHPGLLVVVSFGFRCQ